MRVTTQHAMDLMPQLRDILQLPGDLDLPKLARIEMAADSVDPGWSVRAQLKTLPTDPERWEALSAWGGGTRPQLGFAHMSDDYPSGAYRKATVEIAVAEVSVEIWTHVDAEFEPPQRPADDPPDDEDTDAWPDFHDDPGDI
jgi:hypothetical protein